MAQPIFFFFFTSYPTTSPPFPEDFNLNSRLHFWEKDFCLYQNPVYDHRLIPPLFWIKILLNLNCNLEPCLFYFLEIQKSLFSTFKYRLDNPILIKQNLFIPQKWIFANPSLLPSALLLLLQHPTLTAMFSQAVVFSTSAPSKSNSSLIFLLTTIYSPITTRYDVIPYLDGIDITFGLVKQNTPSCNGTANTWVKVAYPDRPDCNDFSDYLRSPSYSLTSIFVYFTQDSNLHL